jgi:hypothetical protein
MYDFTQFGIYLLLLFPKFYIRKAYSLEYTGIPEVFFMPHHVAHCFFNVIWCHCCSLGHCSTNVIEAEVIAKQRVSTITPIMQVAYSLRRKQQTHRCSSSTLKHVEHPKHKRQRPESLLASLRSHVIPRLVWDLKVHGRVRRNTSPGPILSQINPIHSPTSYALRSI